MSIRNRIVAAISMALFFVLVGTGAASALWLSFNSVGATVKVANLADACTNVTQMLNASFEQPAQASTLGYANDGQMNGWRAKGANGQPVRIEIWNGYDNVPAGVGSQFVELNADEPGTIYQSLTTTPGQTLQWSFLHRGRSGVDTMELFIGAVNAGVSQGSFSDGTGVWNRYSGAYVVPAGQSTTELSFKAVSAAGGPSIGNFLDDVSFGTGPCLTAQTAVTNVTLAGTSYRPGDVLEYTTTVSNVGSSLSQNSIFAGVVPEGLEYQANSITIDGVARTDALAGDQANYVTADRKVVARIGNGATDTLGGTIAQGTQTVVIKYRVKVPAAATGVSYAFTPTVAYVNGLASGWVRTATSNTVTITTVGGADLSTVVTATPSSVGRTSTTATAVQWTWVVTNNGNIPSGGTVTVPISIPTAATLTGNAVPTIAAGQTGSCTLTSCTTTPAIAVGHSRTFSVTRTVTTAAVPGTAYTLTASASSSVADYVAANNSGSATVTVTDTAAPNKPVAYAFASRGQVQLNWPIPADNVGVVSYRIYRAGIAIATTSDLLYVDAGLNASTPYTYTITAIDAAGNESVPSDVMSVTTPATLSATQRFTLRTTHATPYLCFTPDTVANAADIDQNTCGASNNQVGSTAQRVVFTNAGDGFYRITPQNNANLAWAIEPGTNQLLDGAKLQLNTWSSADNQEWAQVAEPGGYVRFINKLTNKCLDINGQSTTLGLQFQQYTCNNTVAQRFTMTAVN
ncbi:hypothetical protein EYE40_01745 [Glaciihabitans arcticus]|uniref:Fibronectin type-III domain-containing protein n=1 Tax=Glaciihabitans arcticus TaxID=2668039 RepID=A0A4Q9GRJ7_9MICO|nr:RICIN domain-containing protein [Glaciihabitans arcticus]TBN56218.1 hypothetical protein EYE40_01745 [Glaciihabitans arcticus]